MENDLETAFVLIEISSELFESLQEYNKTTVDNVNTTFQKAIALFLIQTGNDTSSPKTFDIIHEDLN